MNKKVIAVVVVTIGLVSCVKENESIIALKECPQKIDGLSVELSQNDNYVQTIRITKDGKFLQELKGGDEDNDAFFQGSSSEFNNSMVYYVDANYDGYIDIYIGTGGDRTSNSLLLWNSNKDIFERIETSFLQNPYFSPSENAIYTCGDDGIFDFSYSKNVWKEGALINQEDLEELLFREGFDFDSYNEYNDYKRSKKYALFDSEHKLIVETNEIDGLPNKWAEVLTKEKASWSEYTDVFSTYEELKQHEAKNMEDKIKTQIVEMINEHNGWEVLSGPSSIKNLHKEDNGMYKATFWTETPYETMDYEIQNIEIDEKGKVLGLDTKRVGIRPKANKPDGGIKTVDEIVKHRIGAVGY